MTEIEDKFRTSKEIQDMIDSLKKNNYDYSKSIGDKFASLEKLRKNIIHEEEFYKKIIKEKESLILSFSEEEVNDILVEKHMKIDGFRKICELLLLPSDNYENVSIDCLDSDSPKSKQTLMNDKIKVTRFIY